MNHRAKHLKDNICQYRGWWSLYYMPASLAGEYETFIAATGEFASAGDAVTIRGTNKVLAALGIVIVKSQPNRYHDNDDEPMRVTHV